MKWLFNKTENTHPEFWTNYESLFLEQKEGDITASTYVILDTETTGFNYDKDRMLSIGAVKIINGYIDISTAFEIYIKQDYFDENTVQIHGILKNDKFETVTEDEAIVLFLDYIKDSILVAHNAYFDIGMINAAFKRHGLPELKNKVLDTMHLFRATRTKSTVIPPKKTYSLEDLAEHYDIDLSDRHTASGDALITALAFLKSIHFLIKTKNYTLKELFKL
ncbi:DNA polymerase III epsilon subunit [Formosa agariphila KMM 3901]|uniref:DNA polymerase III epsilon subunit n=1 Tax=Formosa agariphila (strain DSM 15362 / KCTC 12365 / LMG 23005 / KMM 3901 / M-2Alg 35-1) TaxID=1347342 RepID=T2KJK5_FORAG|nr:3'-5' exonuclease [Formosa agariphila]CDF78950.1 DNA polymerase III epsilon subunit [Formosa agariphila KMM 3901]